VIVAIVAPGSHTTSDWNRFQRERHRTRIPALGQKVRVRHGSPSGTKRPSSGGLARFGIWLCGRWPTATALFLKRVIKIIQYRLHINNKREMRTGLYSFILVSEC
jgi:hypothetical protein